MSLALATAEEGRDLVCTDCGLSWQIFELPAPWIDPAQFRCGPCMRAGPRPVTRPTLREMRNARRASGGAVVDAIAVHGQDRDFPRQPGRGGQVVPDLMLEQQPYNPATAEIPF